MIQDLHVVDVDPRLRLPLSKYRVSLPSSASGAALDVEARSVIDAAHVFYAAHLGVKGEVVEQVTFVWALSVDGEPIGEPDVLRVTARRVLVFEGRSI